MELKRKNLNKYESLYEFDYYVLDGSLESIHKALQDTDDNNYIFTQTLIEQNQMLLKQLEILKSQLTNMEMKINYLLDNTKR